MAMPLDGIRVIDWTIWQQGPACSLMLADLGADVIKIEHRETGDPGRGLVMSGGVDLSKIPNSYFEANNRNKRSLTLDLTKPEAKEIVYKLAAVSDVFVQNFRQGVAGRRTVPNVRLSVTNGVGRRGRRSRSGLLDGPTGPARARPGSRD